METEIKTKLTQVLSPLVPDLRDNNPKQIKNTYTLFNISNGSTTPIKRGAKQAITYVTFDIFSTYNGEKEVIDIKNIIEEHIICLYDLDKVNYVQMSAFNILNEESPIRKHGILTYRILSTLI